MNSLRNLLDCADAKEVAVGSEAFHRGIPYASIKHSFLIAENAMCFDFGDMGCNFGVKVFLEIFRLPFPTVWCEFTYETPRNIRIGFLIHEEQGSDRWLVSAFLRMNGPWIIWNTGVALLDENQRPSELRWMATESKTNAETTAAFYAAALGFGAVNCANVTRRQISPDPKLQKARAKRGKKPFFSYWVLEIAGNGRGDRMEGVTHSSPRLHLRRGHPRQYAPGKWTWVQPCAVGNKAMGMVHKDYRLGGGTT